MGRWERQSPKRQSLERQPGEPPRAAATDTAKTRRKRKKATPPPRWPSSFHVLLRGSRCYSLHFLPEFTQLTRRFMIFCDMTFAKSSWSLTGLCFSFGNESTLYWPLSWMSLGMS